MASLGHVAIGLAAGRAWRGRSASTRSLGASMIAFSALSLAPDLDVLGFSRGVPYASPFGHRGASHSLLAAMAAASLIVLARALVRRWRGKPGDEPMTSDARLYLLCAAVALSHGLLDTLTDGGLGVALAWPWSSARWFAPLRPIPVAPLGARMLSARGLRVLSIELLQFCPLWLWALWPRKSARRAE